MANPEDTTIIREEFIDTLPPAAIAPTPRTSSHTPDRLVFFFSGFDPKGATVYHRLFRTGIAQRNATHDETLALGSRHRIARWASVWTTLWREAPAASRERPATMRTRVHFMRWEDIVRRHWRRPAAQLLADYANIYLRGLFQGVLPRIWLQSSRALWLVLFPLGVAVAALAAGLLLVAAPLWGSGWISAPTAALIGLFAGVAGWRALMIWFDCEWLLRVCAFVREQALGNIASLNACIDEMANHVVDAVEARMRQPAAQPLREIMLVGYSTGSITAASVLARALPRLVELLESRRTNGDATLSLLTLGQCVPAASTWPGAKTFRADLGMLAQCERLTWHDYSARADRAAFWRTPPWPKSAALRGRQFSPDFISVARRITEISQPRERWEMHLQYLRPPVRRGDHQAYDFFDLVCGPRTLRQRHDESS